MSTSFSPPFRTERLVLREIVQSDMSEHARLFSDPDVVRYLYVDEMSSDELLAHFARRLWQGAPEEGAWCNLAVQYQGVYVGEVGAHLASAAHRAYEVGYVFLPEYHGRGIATEATRGLMDEVFSTLGAHRIVARLDARNEPSRRVLERLGMRQEAHHLSNEYVKGEWTDELVFAILDEEWVRRS